MAGQLVPIVVGFVLTTVLGGFLGSYFQRRSWDHQNEAKLTEAERRRADEVSQRLSKLLDKRLYRMLRLYYAVHPTEGTSVPREVREQRLADYDATLLEWNDQLNLNLAQVGTYFGEVAKDWLEQQVYGCFQDVGRRLEVAYREVEQTGRATSRADLEQDLQTLNNNVYLLNLFLMTQLREGAVGRSAPHAVLRLTSLTAEGAVPLAGLDDGRSPAADGGSDSGRQGR